MRTSAAQAGLPVPPLQPPGPAIAFVPTPAAVAAATESIALKAGLSPTAAAAAAGLPTGLFKRHGTALAISGALVAILLVGGIGYTVYRRKGHSIDRSPEF
jgi:hypothetical protein